MQVSEHPFDTLKWCDGYHYFLCKGKEIVAAETALAYLGYDFRRAFTLLGVAKLIVFYQGRSLHKCRNREWVPPFSLYKRGRFAAISASFSC